MPPRLRRAEPRVRSTRTAWTPYLPVDAARGPVLWALLALCAMCAGLILYRLATGTTDPIVNVVLLCATVWTAMLGFAGTSMRRKLLVFTPYFGALLVLATLAVLQAFGDPLDERHTNALLGAYLTLPVVYLLFFLLRRPSVALLGSILTGAAAVALQVLLPTAVADRVTTGGWVAAVTSIFHGALILLLFTVPRLRSSRDLLDAVLQSSRDAVMLLTPSAVGRSRRNGDQLSGFLVTLTNRAATSAFGLGVGDDLTRVGPLAEAGELHERLAEAQRFGAEVRLNASLNTLNEAAWFRVTATPFQGGLAVSFADVTEHKDGEDRALALAHTDPLTDLPNRRGFDVEAQRRLGVAGDRQRALAFLDLNGFKLVNDRHGHEVGDLLLKQVAARIRSAVRSQDLVARVGGDEFVLLVEGVAVDMVAPFFERVLHAFDESFAVAGQRLMVGASLGVVTGVVDLATAVAKADAAMYRAKQRGGGIEVVGIRHAGERPDYAVSRS